MNQGFAVAASAMAMLAIPYLWRVMRGPTLFDRMIGMNAIGTKIPVVLVLIGAIYRRSEMFVDLALAVLLLNQFTTLLIARYIRKRAAVAE